jgi:hypothetical protein
MAWLFAGIELYFTSGAVELSDSPRCLLHFRLVLPQPHYYK